MFVCIFCNYQSNNKSNYDKHLHTTKHTSVQSKPVIHEELFCSKCNKSYACKLYLDEHEKECIGIDSLTCETCMKVFSSRQSKHNHVIRNNCKPKSIFTLEHVKHSDNKDIYIRNFGFERVDYMTIDKICNVIQKNGIMIIPEYIALKHLNPEFPENNNIRFHKNVFVIKENNDWKIISSDILVKRLYKKNAYELDQYYYENKSTINNFLGNEDKIELAELYTKASRIEVEKKDKEIYLILKDMMKNGF